MALRPVVPAAADPEGGGAMTQDQGNGEYDLNVLRKRRSELREAMAGLEGAVAAPAPGHLDTWADGVRLQLDQVSADFARHISVTEGPDGFHEQMVTASPRLAGKVARLAREHVSIAEEIQLAQAALDQVADEDGVDEVRRRITDILARLVRHRQRGGDLVWEAFAYDLGGET
jgi:hypothetical protein